MTGGAANDMPFVPLSPFPVRHAQSRIPDAWRPYWLAFLEQVDGWLGDTEDPIYAILDVLRTHRAAEVLLWAGMHPRWEVLVQPTYAPYLTLIESWWKSRRSLALKGRRFATWEGLCVAIAASRSYGNTHRHPCIGGRRKRRRHARPTGIGCLPPAA
jgi:hypothetical protein